jgi:hypothetical protein
MSPQYERDNPTIISIHGYLSINPRPIYFSVFAIQKQEHKQLLPHILYHEYWFLFIVDGLQYLQD